MAKITVLLIFGGESPEHDVSVASAHNVFAALDEEKYEVVLCYITRKGEWQLVKNIDDTTDPLLLVPHLGHGQLEASDGTIIRPAILLPILHGVFGEDGAVQAVARLLHVPCVGPSQLGAGLMMDKDITKRLLKAEGIPVVDWMSWRTSDDRPTYEFASARLGTALFVKPAGAGSSLGVSKANDEQSFVEALDEAVRHGDLVIIETAIVGREIELAVLGNQHPRVSGAGEIIPGKEFYDYADKYDASSAASVVIPAQISTELEQSLQQYARKAYRITRGQGMARIDFFVDGDTIYLNEINSIPGFTNISMYPKLWRYEGISYPELLNLLIEDGLASYTENN